MSNKVSKKIEITEVVKFREISIIKELKIISKIRIWGALIPGNFSIIRSIDISLIK